jgi:hypothetical protein
MPEYASSLRFCNASKEKQKWENLSNEIHKKYKNGGKFAHIAMRLYFNFDTFPVTDPQDLADGHNYLQKVQPPQDVS